MRIHAHQVARCQCGGLPVVDGPYVNRCPDCGDILEWEYDSGNGGMDKARARRDGRNSAEEGG